MGNQLLHLFVRPSVSSLSFKTHHKRLSSNINGYKKGSPSVYYLFLFLFHSTLFIKTIQTATQQQHQEQQISTTTIASISTSQVPPCEHKVLEEIPPDPVS